MLLSLFMEPRLVCMGLLNVNVWSVYYRRSLGLENVFMVQLRHVHMELHRVCS